MHSTVRLDLPNIVINGTSLSYLEYVTYLGVSMDSNLSFDNHAKQTSPHTTRDK
ncbi:hypothetical protein Bhyg_10134 [Pseudolycoriella hygida]|uniref:Uncharacterized protein n=1 Tax=Pseudolycoriella hygida TaxID=35572 RepID=A0A9Q0MUP1_9DIPT|nr:hypothetical protein Bhyg_10134 [Pseudolycoriella hygida]